MNGNDTNFDPNAGRTAASSSEYQGGYSSPSAESAQPYGSVPPGDPAYTAADPAGYPPNAGAAGPGYAPPYGYTAPPTPGSSNPGLATLLGFIPGVGAMYNGQFVKGIAHIIIFSILTSLSNHVHGAFDALFGLLSAGWYFYMVLDAYQTARARRDGLIPPDPFGLNNIGERIGIPVNPNWSDFVARPANAATDSARTSNPYAGPGMGAAEPVPPSAWQGYPPPPPAYSVPPDAVRSYAEAQAAGDRAYADASTGAFAGYGQPASPYGVPPAGVPYGAAPYGAAAPYAAGAPGYPPGYAPAYGTPYAAQMPPVAPAVAFDPASPTRSGLPVGAFWLIGLGLLALLGSLGHSFYWTGAYIGALLPLVIGIGLLLQRVFAAKNFYPTGTAAHRWYLFTHSRFPILLIVAGVLTLLNNLGFAYWSHTWPYLLILFGLLQVANRALYNQMLAEGPIQPLGSPYTPQPATTAASEQQEVR